MEKFDGPAVPDGSVALALAFLNLGPEDPARPFGRLIPGDANRQIAEKLEALADNFSLVLTQQAVSDALDDSTRLADGTPVYQMHRHCEVPVYTFAALQCALDRLPPGDWPLVVIAHPRHLRRIRMGLSALAPDRHIGYIASGPVCYQDSHWFRPLFWTLKNGLGWLVDGLLVISRRWVWAAKLLHWPLGLISAHPRCPQKARIAPIDI